MPELNTQLFQKVYDQIVARPDTHEQAGSEEFSSCGTTRCVAGWAILVDALDRGETVRSFRDSTTYVAAGRPPSGLARELLGITYEEGDYLFFQVSNEEAVEIVKAAARGVRPPVSEEG